MAMIVAQRSRRPLRKDFLQVHPASNVLHLYLRNL